jgi:serine/threonine protein kinase
MISEGAQIGPYHLIHKLGRGGFGEVWLAERRTKFVTTKVAVKMPIGSVVDPEAIKLEAELWEQASGHPNVLPIIEADEYDGHIVIVSEYAPGGSLDDLLERENTLSIRKSVEMTIEILKGLEFLHSREIIHRDIKPANVLLQGDTPRLTDFGISRLVKATSISLNVGGTPSYMAPEAFDRKRTVQTDVWSVGVVLYRMLTGYLPFAEGSFTDLLGSIVKDNPQDFPDFVPNELRRIILRALEKLPDHRYQNTRAMNEDLTNYLLRISKDAVELTIEDERLVSTLLTDETFDRNVQRNPGQRSSRKVQTVLRERIWEKSRLGRKRVGLFMLLLLFFVVSFYEGNVLFQKYSQPNSAAKEFQRAPFRKGDKELCGDYRGKEDDTSAVSQKIRSCGFIDKDGNSIIPFKYDQAGFVGDMARVALDGKEFFVDRNGVEYGEP